MSLFDRVCESIVATRPAPTSWMSKVVSGSRSGERRSPENVAVAQIGAANSGLRTAFLKATSGDESATKKVKSSAKTIRGAADVLLRAKRFEEAVESLQGASKIVYEVVSRLTTSKPTVGLYDVAAEIFGTSAEDVIKTASAMKTLHEKGLVSYNIKTGYTLREE